MQGALSLGLQNGRAVWAPAPALPVAALMLGRRPEDAAALLPRLFNLCRQAQGLAVRLALGLEPGGEGLAPEILRDHLAKLFLRWPALLGLKAAMPADWAAGGARLRAALTGPAGLPDAAGFELWLAGGAGVAPVLHAIDRTFAPGEAVARLPAVTPATALHPGARENSVAARQAAHPLLRHVAATRGQGPLWQASARLVDALACLDGTLPAPVVLADGTAVVPAARGLFAVQARAEAGVVVAFDRRTPTDHLCAPGGGMDLCLAGLEGASLARLALLVDILDPCVPVHLREGADA